MAVAEMDVLFAPVSLIHLWRPSPQYLFLILQFLCEISRSPSASHPCITQQTAVQPNAFHLVSWGGWTWGQSAILFSWELCCIHRKLSHKSWMFPEWWKAYVSNVEWGRITIGPWSRSEVWGSLVKMVFKSRQRSMLQCVIYSNSTMPENNVSQSICKNQRRGNLANFVS